MSTQACGFCGKDPAEGYADVDGVRYCHGDDDLVPTCYMQAQGAIEPRSWLSFSLLDVKGDPHEHRP